ncbi:MAG TPA: hypothetical protein PLU22_20400 [Polyangiaceae bacterium]|nr:hypothetical protein [Polyangiaceae bacterium]
MGASSTPGRWAASRGREDAPRLLVAGEDAVLLTAMARAVAWRRPDLAVESASGLDRVRRALRERAFDAMVVAIEPRSETGAAMLKVARLYHPGVIRVAYRACAECEGPEVRLADVLVAPPADIQALLVALESALHAPRVRERPGATLRTPA